MEICKECGAGRDHIAGVEVRGIYDGVCYWACISCNAKWHRFEEGDRRRERVESYWAGK